MGGINCPVKCFQVFRPKKDEGDSKYKLIIIIQLPGSALNITFSRLLYYTYDWFVIPINLVSCLKYKEMEDKEKSELFMVT